MAETKQNTSLNGKNKMLSEKESTKKIKDLKIELLKSPTKRGRIKKEIARLLTMERLRNNELKIKNSDSKKTKDKLVGDKS